MQNTSSFPDLVRFLVWAVCGWVVLVVLTAPAFYLDRALTRGYAHAGSALGLAFVASAGWAVIAVLILTLGFELQRHRLHIAVRIGGHLLLGLAVVFIMLLLMRRWNWPVLGLAEVLRAPHLAAALAAGWPRGLAIYAALWSACQLGLLWPRYTRLKAQLVSAELRRLRTQLNPHFLFNTLNAISELGYTDPEAADRTITRLSGLLRKSLDDSHQQEITLRDELDFLRRYLEIQQTLLRGRLHLEFEVDDHALNARVPGMILQPLVENAVTHGIGRGGSGYITLRGWREDDVLVIEVEDNGRGLVAAAPRGAREGIGIANTRARLNYLYGDLASLELKSRMGEGLIARLNIPFHEAYAFDENPHPDR